MVGQGPAVLAAGAGRVGCFLFFFISSIQSSRGETIHRNYCASRFSGQASFSPYFDMVRFTRV